MSHKQNVKINRNQPGGNIFNTGENITAPKSRPNYDVYQVTDYRLVLYIVIIQPILIILIPMLVPNIQVFRLTIDYVV